jgi:endopeptidase Clp ATP-binding regulatory subunit ClpX
MNPRAEKMGLDPEKLRQLLAQQLEEQDETPTQPDASSTQPGSAPTADSRAFDFDLKPEELEAYLDLYVIRQPEAKAILATKICTHFNRLNLPPEDDESIVGNIKNNVLMIGPTGVGKTYLIRLIARKLGVPFVKGDATKFSETGYVGGDVEDLVRELVRDADGDIERAQYGIIYIDEIDKIASSRGMHGPDVSRSGVQRNLLKLMEETDVDLKAPHDIASQMESVIQMQQTGKIERQKINTRNILFIVSGAFSGLDEIIGRRLNKNAMGFRSKQPEGTAVPDQLEESDLLSHVRAEDLLEYGFESEFIGRLPVIAILHSLASKDLFEILRNPKSNVILSKKRDFRAYGIEVEFAEEALELLAERAFEEHIGARGLVSAIEKVLLNFEKKLPSVSIDRFAVDANTVLDPRASLERLLQDTALRNFLDDFLQEHGISLIVAPEAAAQIETLACKRQISPRELCEEMFNDYGHGLKLAGLSEFNIGSEVVSAPQETLNALIKAYYNKRR